MVVTAKAAGTTYKLEKERGARDQIMVVTAEGPRMTYILEVERGGQELRSQLWLQRDQG
jgi:hypothetical protein